MLTLPEKKSQIKTLEPLNELGPEGVAASTSDVGTIVIKISLGGISSIQIVTEESTVEEALCERLTAVRPILKLLHAGVRGEG